MQRKKSPNERIGKNPHCHCQILFIPDVDGNLNVPEDKIAVAAKGSFTFQVCKFCEGRDHGSKPARKAVGDGKGPNADPTEVIHHDVIVIAVGGICRESELRDKRTGAFVPRADAGVYLGERNPLNGGAIVNPRGYGTPATIELAYLVGVKEALLRGKIVASDSSFKLEQVAESGAGPSSGERRRGRLWDVGLDPVRLGLLLGVSLSGPEQVRYMDECKKRADEDMAMGGIPAEACCLAMLPYKNVHLSRIIIKSDSDYINKIVLPNMHKWSQNGWKTSRGRQIKYRREVEELRDWIRALMHVGVLVVFWPVKRSENKQAIERAIRGSNMVPERKAIKPVIQWTQLEGEEEGLDLGMGFPPEGMKTYHDCEREKDPDGGQEDDPKGKGKQKDDPEAYGRSTKCRIYHKCEDDRKCQAKRINRRIQALRRRQAKHGDLSHEDAQNEAQPADPVDESLLDSRSMRCSCSRAQCLMDWYREIHSGSLSPRPSLGTAARQGPAEWLAILDSLDFPYKP
ncbi:hypothetical protein SLS53_002606 [Cytospora paraplurivora]|uniref:RNase H type-1 domain-containing protein n=1 Tax=Cytospora paraplurivora TaxID=2898453 RepID=A0AAN9UFN6_9PEZI